MDWKWAIESERRRKPKHADADTKYWRKPRDGRRVADERVDRIDVVALRDGTQLAGQLRHDVLRALSPCRRARQHRAHLVEGGLRGAACAAPVSPAVGQCGCVQHSAFRSATPLAGAARCQPRRRRLPAGSPRVRAPHRGRAASGCRCAPCALRRPRTSCLRRE